MSSLNYCLFLFGNRSGSNLVSGSWGSVPGPAMASGGLRRKHPETYKANVFIGVQGSSLVQSGGSGARLRGAGCDRAKVWASAKGVSHRNWTIGNICVAICGIEVLAKYALALPHGRGGWCYSGAAAFNFPRGDRLFSLGRWTRALGIRRNTRTSLTTTTSNNHAPGHPSGRS